MKGLGGTGRYSLNGPFPTMQRDVKHSPYNFRCILSDSLQAAMPEPIASLTTRGVRRPQQQQSHHDDISRRRYVRFLGQRIVKKYKRFARELEFRRLQSAVPEVRGREAVSKESDLIAFVAVLVNVCL